MTVNLRAALPIEAPTSLTIDTSINAMIEQSKEMAETPPHSTSSDTISFHTPEGIKININKHTGDEGIELLKIHLIRHYLGYQTITDGSIGPEIKELPRIIFDHYRGHAANFKVWYENYQTRWESFSEQCEEILSLRSSFMTNLSALEITPYAKNWVAMMEYLMSEGGYDLFDIIEEAAVITELYDQKFYRCSGWIKEIRFEWEYGATLSLWYEKVKEFAQEWKTGIESSVQSGEPFFEAVNKSSKEVNIPSLNVIPFGFVIQHLVDEGWVDAPDLLLWYELKGDKKTWYNNHFTRENPINI